MAIVPTPVRLDRPAWVLVWLTGHYCGQVVGGRVHGSADDARRAHKRFCVKLQEKMEVRQVLIQEGAE
jgi:hypothetical protein